MSLSPIRIRWRARHCPWRASSPRRGRKRKEIYDCSHHANKTVDRGGVGRREQMQMEEIVPRVLDYYSIATMENGILPCPRGETPDGPPPRKSPPNPLMSPSNASWPADVGHRVSHPVRCRRSRLGGPSTSCPLPTTRFRCRCRHWDWCTARSRCPSCSRCSRCRWRSSTNRCCWSLRGGGGG